MTLSGVVLDRSLIDYGPLALDRFDLVPTLFVLAAVLARDRRRSATWSGLLSIGVAIKAFPLFLYPALLRGERNLRRVIVAGAIPLLLCAAAVIVMGDEFGSAISYHTERTLQVESLGASVFEVAHVLGASGVSTGVGHGGFEISASGATAARWVSVVIGAAGYLWLVSAGWRSKATNFELVAALLAVLVVFAPVLSPQFLLWLLPVSACAYGLRRENVVLLLAIVFTQIELQHYDGVDALTGSFVWPLAVRNLLLLVYLALVAAPILRPASASGFTVERRHVGRELRLRLVVLEVDLGVLLPLLRELVLGEARVDGARLDAGVAVDALVRIDEELLDVVVVGLVRRGMDAVDGADLYAGVVLLADAGLRDDVCQGAVFLSRVVVATAAPIGRRGTRHFR